MLMFGSIFLQLALGTPLLDIALILGMCPAVVVESLGARIDHRDTDLCLSQHLRGRTGQQWYLSQRFDLDITVSITTAI